MSSDTALHVENRPTTEARSRRALAARRAGRAERPAAPGSWAAWRASARSPVDRQPSASRHEQAVVDEHRRAPRRTAGCHRRRRRSASRASAADRAAEQALDSVVPLVRRERLEQEQRRVGLGRPPSRARRSSSSGRAAQTSSTGAVARPVTRCSTRSRKRRLGPVDVVEHDDERPARRASASRSCARAQNVSSSAAAAGRQAEQRRQPARIRSRPSAASSVAIAARGLGESSSSIPAAARSDLRDRPERDALAVGQAAAPRAPCLAAAPRQRTPPSAASCRRRPAPSTVTTRADPRPRARQASEQAPSSRSRRRAGRRAAGVSPAAPARRRAGGTPAPAADLPLSASGSTGSTVDRVRERGLACLTDQDLARRRRLLQARGDIHRVAGHERLRARRVAGHDLAGVDPIRGRSTPCRWRRLDAHGRAPSTSRMSAAARTARSASSS